MQGHLVLSQYNLLADELAQKLLQYVMSLFFLDHFQEMYR